MIPTPIAQQFDVDAGCSLLTFSGKREHATEPSTGRYHVRGGIRWPNLSVDGILDGFAVVCGQELDTGRIYVFEEKPFSTVENIYKDDGNLEYEGLSSWLNLMWTRYYCNTFYDNEWPEARKVFHLQVLRSHNITPKPRMPEVFWREDGEPLSRMWELGQAHKLIFGKDGKVHNAVRMVTADVGRRPSSAVWSLLCCLTGILRCPSKSKRAS